MPKVKPKRHVPLIDMTAMVDVAFLLLTFFILTAKFRAEEKAPVDTPKAETISEKELKENEMCLITVTPDGRIFMGLGDPPTRQRMLERVASSFNLQISDQGKAFFTNSTEFGVPINELPGWLNQQSADGLKEFKHKGIPVDKRRGRLNELGEWIQAARRSNTGLKFAIKGDRDVLYEHMDKVIYTLQDVNINRFSLITKLEGDPNAKPAEGGESGEGGGGE